MEFIGGADKFLARCLDEGLNLIERFAVLGGGGHFSESGCLAALLFGFKKANDVGELCSDFRSVRSREAVHAPNRNSWRLARYGWPVRFKYFPGW